MSEEEKEKKHLILKTQLDFLKGDKKFLMALKAKYFRIGEGKGRS